MSMAVRVANPEGDSAESARLPRDHLESRNQRGLVVFDRAADPDVLRRFCVLLVARGWR
jgi:hypothetical protein